MQQLARAILSCGAHPALPSSCHAAMPLSPPCTLLCPTLQRVVPAATVEIVGNGALALEAALARRPDLILMDIHMPGQRLCLLEEVACMRCMLSWPVCACRHACQLLLPPPPPAATLACNHSVVSPLRLPCRDGRH